MGHKAPTSAPPASPWSAPTPDTRPKMSPMKPKAAASTSIHHSIERSLFLCARWAGRM